jgi:putative toxin-antitoxin system antitoxin component (TIGR02293 family)
MAGASVETIARLFGGKKTLGSIPEPRQQIEIVERGIPWKALVHLKEALHLTDREFAHTLGISERTLSRKRGAGNRVNLLISDRLFRLARISAMAIEIFETPQEAAAWLKEPQFGLGERVPLGLLRTEMGAREVEDLLGRLKHGVLA